MKTVDIERKGIAIYEENRKRARKYQIEDENWLDWFRMGYQQAEKDCGSRWISIDDRINKMPNDKDILIRLEDGSVRRYEEEWEEEFGLSGIVTHWMAIPDIL